MGRKEFLRLVKAARLCTKVVRDVNGGRKIFGRPKYGDVILAPGGGGHRCITVDQDGNLKEWVTYARAVEILGILAD